MTTELPAIPDIAVVIPCRDAARYVGAAVGSALAQTLPPREVVVVDDGSTDDLEASLAPVRDRIRLLRQANRGVSAARNRGIAATSAGLIALLDADDVWAPRKLERQVARLRERPEACLVHTRVRRIDPDGNPLGFTHALRRQRRLDGRCLAALAGMCAVYPSSVLIRRDRLGDERFEESLRSSEDWDLWLRLAARHPFAFLEEPLTCYRRHPASATSDHFMTALNALAVVDRLLEREPGLRVRLAALRSRARAKIRLANVLYERGELRIARHLLLHHLPWLGAADGARLLATMLPAPVRAPGRAVWRRVRAC